MSNIRRRAGRHTLCLVSSCVICYQLVALLVVAVCGDCGSLSPGKGAVLAASALKTRAAPSEPVVVHSYHVPVTRNKLLPYNRPTRIWGVSEIPSTTTALV